MHKQPLPGDAPFAGHAVAIALLTRRPHRFDYWLRHHLSLGVACVFVHVEATPELLPMLRSDEFAPFVLLTVDDAAEAVPLNNFYTLMQRQKAHVNRALDACRALTPHFTRSLVGACVDSNQ